MRRRLAPADNYVFLLTGLLLFFLLVPALHTLIASGEKARLLRFFVQGGFSGMMLVGVWSLAQERRVFRAGLGLGLLSVVLASLGGGERNLALDLGHALTVLAFCAVSGVIAGRHVFSGTEVNRNTLYGAMCVYLLMGMAWAVVYTLIYDLQPAAFHGMDAPGGPAALDDFLYFSFVTLASLGYGDITPAAPLARTLAYLEVIAGQFYIAIMVAGLVGIYMQRREGR